MKGYRNIFKKITNAVLADYLELFYIDLETNAYICFRKEDVPPVEPQGSDYFTTCRKDAEICVYADDRERFISGLSKERLIACIQKNSDNSAEYRLLIDQKPVWCNIRIVHGEYTEEDRYAILGVRDVNDQKMASEELVEAEHEREKLTQIADALANIFDSIYYVDLTDNSFMEFSSSDRYKKIRTTDHGKDFFYLAKPLLGKYIHPNDVDKIICIQDKNEMLKALGSHKGAYATEYRFIINGAIYYCRAGIRITRDRSHVLVSITNLGLEENIEKKLQESERLSLTYSKIAERLAEHYDNIYYVNVNTDEYMTFSSVRLVSELEKTERQSHFFANVSHDIDKMIYYEDREAVRGFFDKERLMEDLRTHNVRQLEYRLLINEDPTYVRLIAMLTKDNENLLICVENIHKQVLNYRDLSKKATSDGLTGAKNKNAYKEYEAELNGQIASGEAEFAIVECDVNNLKTINDTMGHSAGDAYIKSACSLICNIFVHSPVFRVGGDEFIVVLLGQDYQNREALFRELQDRASQNVKYAIDPARPVIAAGMCVFTDEYASVEEVFNEADQSMYEDKRQLKGMI